MKYSDVQMPTSALDFYVKLYCRKRGKNKSKLQNVISEATKSWLTLSKSEKHHFTTKYEHIKRNIKNQLANQLKNAVPYLKKKEVPVSRALVESNTKEVVIEGNNTILGEIDQIAAGASEIPYTEGNTADQTSNFCEENNANNVIEKSIQEQPNGNLYENWNIPLSEPIPPKLLTAEQLFNMVNESKNDQSWAALTIHEKRMYQNAVLSIKRNYLKEYQKYLEQLPSEKLYKLYKNSVSLE